ncbi:MAG: formylglycine-generating enzyme family protein [bacterium]
MPARRDQHQIVSNNPEIHKGGLRRQAALSRAHTRARTRASLIACVALAGLLAAVGAQDVKSGAQQASEPASVAPVANGGFKQPIDGSTFEIELVPFKATDGGTLFVSTTEMPWELFDVFVYGSDKTEGKSNDKADAVTKPTKPYIGMDREFGHVGFPVISPSFLSVKQFCEWLSAKTGRTYRLPTAAEWTALCEQSGIDPKNCDDHAWLRENASEKTHKLASKKADKLGLYDLFGNACEWVDDGSKLGVVAGGSYLDSMADLGCGVFQPCKPVEWNEIDPQFPKSKWWYSSGGFVGFRVICDKP